jgi:hypothetical protein
MLSAWSLADADLRRLSAMLDFDRREVVSARLRAAQIIVAAMVIGALAFLAVVHFLVPPNATGGSAARQSAIPIITYAAMAYAVTAIILGPIFATLMTTSTRRRLAKALPPEALRQAGSDDKAKRLAEAVVSGLSALFLGKTIVNAALFEGGALFLGVAYMLERKPLVAVMAAILIVGLLSLVPTRDRANRWMDEQLRMLEEERHG